MNDIQKPQRLLSSFVVSLTPEQHAFVAKFAVESRVMMQDAVAELVEIGILHVQEVERLEGGAA